MSALPIALHQCKFAKLANGSRPRVLYAEDSTSSRIVTTALLQRMGLEVDAVEDGELALKQAEKQSYDVILLDIEMPVMDGVSAARSIRALGGAASKTPILALSAFLADSTEQSLWRGAFDLALLKPANGNELHRAISTALEGRETTAPPASAAGMSGIMTSLPPGLWGKFMAMAAAEGRHYATAAAFAFVAGDEETTRRCAHALRGLAGNFSASRVCNAALAVENGQMNGPSMLELLHLAGEWENTARAA